MVQQIVQKRQTKENDKRMMHYKNAMDVKLIHFTVAFVITVLTSTSYS